MQQHFIWHIAYIYHKCDRIVCTGLNLTCDKIKLRNISFVWLVGVIRCYVSLFVVLSATELMTSSKQITVLFFPGKSFFEERYFLDSELRTCSYLFFNLSKVEHL